ncbi:MAG: transposase [Armatimonadota bacterium]
MPEPLRPNYAQWYLFPPVLEDWIPADHPVQFVRDFVASLDLVALGFAPALVNLELVTEPAPAAFAKERFRWEPAANQYICPQGQALPFVKPKMRLFGHIKQGLGFRRWTVAGLEAVQAQWALVCTTVNLQRFLGWWQAGRFDLAWVRAVVRQSIDA